METAKVMKLDDARRMKDADYAKARAEIVRVHGTSSKDASARFEQEFALLFERSGWTQEELARVEGKSQPYVAQMLVFGRFLTFIATGNNSSSAFPGITERSFRKQWEKTAREGADKTRDEYRRFTEVRKLLEEPAENKAAPAKTAGVGWATAVLAELMGVRGPFAGKTLLNKKAEIEAHLGRKIPKTLTPGSDDVMEIAAVVQRFADQRSPSVLTLEKSSLPETAQQKLDRLVKREFALLRAKFDKEVETKARKRAEEIAADMQRFYKVSIEKAEQAKDEYKRLSRKVNQIMTHEEFRLIRSCLHSDRQSETERKKYDRAFEIFNRIGQSISWD